MDIRPGATIAGPEGESLTIETLIGGGGFGQVFRAARPDGSLVAVKTIHTGALDDSSLKTLLNEAQHAVSVRHPNVIQILYVNDGKVGGNAPYIVMEYAEGGNLRGLLQERRATKTVLTPDELTELYRQIAEGMCAVNAVLVHRDVKPENVLLTAEGAIKIADFGLAKLADAATRSDTFKGAGTRAYQSPEAFDGSANTPAMDMYSTGIMYFESAALELPIEPKPGEFGPIAWRNAHLLTAPKKLGDIRRDLPPAVVQLIAKMLDKDPRKRPEWSAILMRLRAPAPASGAPDVSKLVGLATARFQAATQAESAARAERERQEERHALLVSAFQQGPIEQLKELVDEYNAQTEIGALTWKATALTRVEVTSPRRQSLVLRSLPIADLDLGGRDGYVRIVGSARIEPQPSAVRQEDLWDQSSFGGFNLAYIVRSQDDRFGDWQLFRFEVSPLTNQRHYPHWHDLWLESFQEQLRVLRSMGIYQHQRRALDALWFSQLLEHIV